MSQIPQKHQNMAMRVSVLNKDGTETVVPFGIVPPNNRKESLPPIVTLVTTQSTQTEFDAEIKTDSETQTNLMEEPEAQPKVKLKSPTQQTVSQMTQTQQNVKQMSQTQPKIKTESSAQQKLKSGPARQLKLKAGPVAQIKLNPKPASHPKLKIRPSSQPKFKPGPAPQPKLKPGPAPQSILKSGPASQSILKSGPASQSILRSGPASQSILKSGPASQSILKSGPASQSILISGPASQSILISGPASQSIFSILKAGSASQSILKQGPVSQSIFYPGPASQSILNPLPASQSILKSGPASQAILKPGPASQSILNPGLPSQSILKKGLAAAHLKLKQGATAHAVLESKACKERRGSLLNATAIEVGRRPLPGLTCPVENNSFQRSNFDANMRIDLSSPKVLAQLYIAMLPDNRSLYEEMHMYFGSRLEVEGFPSTFGIHTTTGLRIGKDITDLEELLRKTPNLAQLELIVLPTHAITSKIIFKREELTREESIMKRSEDDEPAFEIKSFETLIINDRTAYFQNNRTYTPGFITDLYLLGPSLKRLHLKLQHELAVKRFINRLRLLPRFSINELNLSCPINEKQIKKVNACEFRLKSLSMTKLYLVESDDVSQLAKLLDHQSITLEYLALGYESMQGRIQHTILPIMPKLIHFNVVESAGSKKLPIDIFHEKQLPKLEIIKTSKVHFEKLFKKQFRTNAECLKIYDCEELRLIEFQRMPIRFTCLKKLTMSRISAYGLRLISRYLHNLDTLSLKDCLLEEGDSLVTGLSSKDCMKYTTEWTRLKNPLVIQKLRLGAASNICDLRTLKKLKIEVSHDVSEDDNLSDASALLGFCQMAQKLDKLILRNTLITKSFKQLLKFQHNGVELSDTPKPRPIPTPLKPNNSIVKGAVDPNALPPPPPPPQINLSDRINLTHSNSPSPYSSTLSLQTPDEDFETDNYSNYESESQ